MKQQLEQYVTAKLLAMQREKQGVFPPYPTKAELFKAIDNDIKALLNTMYLDKKIKVHKTVHAPIQDYVELITDRNNE